MSPAKISTININKILDGAQRRNPILIIKQGYSLFTLESQHHSYLMLLHSTTTTNCRAAFRSQSNISDGAFYEDSHLRWLAWF